MGSFAIVDVETTGLHPGYHHRIVEIAVVILNENLDIEYEWDTLVNPHRDVGAGDIHGLTATHLNRAPSFSDIAGDLLYLLVGRVVVAHNAQFDLRFLCAELERLGLTATSEGLCTLRLASSAGFPSRLGDCCSAMGVPLKDAHTALCDARGVAMMFPLLWAKAAHPSPETSPLGVSPDDPVARTGRRWTRIDAAAPAPNVTFLSRLIERLPSAPLGAVDAPPGAALAYAGMLDRALEDRVLSDTETEELAAIAVDVGLSLEDVASIHVSYLTSLVAVALADGVVTSAEQTDLECVADLLCVDRSALMSFTEAATPAIRHLAHQNRAAGFGIELAGKSVCFTGTSVCSVSGQSLTRATSELLAAAAGLVVAPRVTKKLDILVVADPNTLSSKAETARTYGTRIIGERTFWPSLGVTID